MELGTLHKYKPPCDIIFFKFNWNYFLLRAKIIFIYKIIILNANVYSFCVYIFFQAILWNN